MQEELEVRLEEIKSVPEWSNYPHDTRAMATLTQTKPTNSPQYPGPVKLELEGMSIVTYTNVPNCI